MMRKLFWLIVILAVGWSAYWFVGARAVTGQANTWFDDRRADGWAADVADVTTQGFPNRFDTTFTDIQLADPATGVGWSAPMFQVLALSYRPTSVIAVWPDTQTLFAPDGQMTITSQDMRASVDLTATPSLALKQARFALDQVSLVSDGGWSSAIQDGIAAMRLVDGSDATYDIHFNATDMVPGALFKGIIDPQNRLPDTFQTATMDVQVTFDRAWDRSAIEQARPQPTQFDLKNLQAIWGDLDLRLAGAGDVDRAGRITGDVTFKVTNWRQALALAVENGTLPANIAGTLEGLLGGLARASGPDNTIDVPLSIVGGQMRLGFIPLGPAPLLRLR
ncbi:MAG: DUF2125 domain-containing protein [Pseudomonadota bacterium]